MWIRFYEYVEYVMFEYKLICIWPEYGQKMMWLRWSQVLFMVVSENDVVESNVMHGSVMHPYI